MPPRVVKRGAAAAAARKTTRPSKPKPQADQKQTEIVAEEAPKVEEKLAVEEKEVVTEEKVVLREKKPVVEEKDVAMEEKAVDEQRPNLEEKQPMEGEPETKHKLDGVGLVSNNQEYEVKESADEYGKDERLELDDNEVEYEHEEYGGMDFDEKEVEQEDIEEVREEDVHEVDDENIGEEEEGDIVVEELEEVAEEFEGEEDEEHNGEEDGQAGMHEPDEDEEHHEVLKERCKRKEFEIFVGGLDKDATESDLRKVFSKVGEVTEVRLMINPQTKKNKGFAFLRFATVEQAKRAVLELKHPVINGKQCGVSPSQDSDTLFLGNICKTWTKDALKDKLKHYGVENIDDLTLVEDTNNQGMNRGFAFLEFSSRTEAMDAFKRLQKKDVMFGVERPAKVSFADSFIDPGDEIMAQVKTLFIDGLPASWDEERVRELLKSYGAIEKVELARNMPSARRKDFGFVTFDSHDAAVTCAKSINNTELGGGDNKAKVRARLSRPLQRGKGKHSSRVEKRPKRKSGRPVRGPWVRPAPRSIPPRAARVIPSRSINKPVGLRDRRPLMSPPVRARPPAPPPRSYDRRAPAPAFKKSSMKREYSRYDDYPPPRSRAAAADYSSRAVPERRPSYRDEYTSRSGGYADLPRGSSRAETRRVYIDDGYGQRFERPPPSFREGRPRDYDSVSGSKRPYSAMDDGPARYGDVSPRHPRARIDYDLGPSASQYGDAYGDRLGRSNVGYGGSRSSLSSHDTHGLYGSRHSMAYGGSYGGSSSGGMYPSSYGSDYVARGADVGGSSYSSMYPSRGMGSGGYMGSGGSGSYY